MNLVPFINPAAFGGGVSIADEQHQAVIVQEILDVIAKMKPIYKNVEKLHILEYTTPEISELLGIPEGTVTSRLRKFRQLIREYLEMDAPPPEQAEAYPRFLHIKHFFGTRRRELRFRTQRKRKSIFLKKSFFLFQSDSFARVARLI